METACRFLSIFSQVFGRNAEKAITGRNSQSVRAWRARSDPALSFSVRLEKNEKFLTNVLKNVLTRNQRNASRPHRTAGGGVSYDNGASGHHRVFRSL
jgi:hypothetical protein